MGEVVKFPRRKQTTFHYDPATAVYTMPSATSYKVRVDTSSGPPQVMTVEAESEDEALSVVLDRLLPNRID